MSIIPSPMGRRETIIQRLLDKSHDEPAPDWLPPEYGPCRIWDGATSGSGNVNGKQVRGGPYPKIHIDGMNARAHIVMFTCVHGFVPRAKEIDHICIRPLCIAEKHLQMLTRLQNIKLRDKRAKQQNDISSGTKRRLPGNTKRSETPYIAHLKSGTSTISSILTSNGQVGPYSIYCQGV
jgi:hypothetical protein